MIEHFASNKSATDKNAQNQLLDNLPVAVYTCDAKGKIVSYNTAAVKLWGAAPQKGQEAYCELWRVFYPDGEPLPPERCPVAVALKTGTAINGEEFIAERPDKSRVHILSYAVPQFDEKGKLTGAIDTLIDITAQKQGESTEAMLAAIITSSDDAIISKTLNGTITTWNEAAENMYGFTSEEAMGQHISLIIPNERLDEETIIIDKIKHGERIEHFETVRKSKDGLLIPVSLTISPIKDAAGTVVGASKIARNITRIKDADSMLKRYADKLEILNDFSKVVSESLDIETILQIVTDTTTRLTEAAFGAFFYNKTDDKGESYTLYTLSGAPRDAFEKFGMPRNTAVFNATFTGEGIVRVDDITKDPRYGHNPPHHGQPKGHLPVVSYMAIPVRSKDGSVIGGLFFGHPEPGRFTEEHQQLLEGVVLQAKKALDNAKMYDEIKSLNEKKDEFIGLASHELRTPVTSLKGYLQIFERGLAEDDQNKTYIKKAVRQVNKLSALIGDLLDVSKIETGRLALSFSAFNLKHLLQEEIELMQYSSRSHQLNFSSNEDELIVKADKQRIEQVIVNLISNAIKYSPHGDSVNISLSKKGNKARVEVQDFGIGILPEQQARIFSRFYRVDELAAHISGLGIGLYISKEIITRHNGQLKVTSEPGKGSTFWFEIPL